MKKLEKREAKKQDRGTNSISANSSSDIFFNRSSTLSDSSTISGSSRYGKALSISSMTLLLLSKVKASLTLVNTD